MIDASHEDERITQERTRIDPLRDRAGLGVLAEVSSRLAASDDYLTMLEGVLKYARAGRIADEPHDLARGRRRARRGCMGILRA